MIGTRGCWSPSLSPDGQRVAFVSDVDGSSRGYVAAVTPGADWAPRAIGGDAGEVESVAWSHTAVGAPGWLLLTGGGALRALPADGDGPGRLIEGPLGGTAFPGCWLPGRPTYAFTAVGPDDADVVALDVETGARAVLAEGGGLLVTDVSADGRAVVRRGPRGRRHLAVPDLHGELRRLVPRDLPGGSEEGTFAPDGTGIWLRTEAGRDLFALGFVDAGHDLRIVAARDDAELERYALSADGQTLVLAWNAIDAGGASELELLDVRTGERSAVHGLPHGVVGGLALSADGRVLVADVCTPQSPRHLIRIDLTDTTKAAAQRLSPVPTDAAAVTPELVRITAHDGVELCALLYRPAGAQGSLPTVVSLHGGPEAQERPTYSPLLQSLVAAGLAVLAPNVRGSSGYGRTFVELDSGIHRLDAVRDVATCASWLMEAGLAEPGRLGVHGTSYGGYLVLASIVEHRSTFAAAVSVCGISDFLTFFAGTEPWIATAARTKYGDPAIDTALLQRLSPLHGLHAARTPTLLVHGEEDTNVPVTEARAAHAELLAGGVPSELVVLPGEGHSLQRPESRLAELTAVTGWFGRWL